MNSYGIDKPDLRIKGLKIENITEVVKRSEFKVFTEAIEGGGIAARINLSGKEISRKIIDGLTDL